MHTKYSYPWLYRCEVIQGRLLLSEGIISYLTSIMC